MHIKLLLVFHILYCLQFSSSDTSDELVSSKERKLAYGVEQVPCVSAIITWLLCHCCPELYERECLLAPNLLCFCLLSSL